MAEDETIDLTFIGLHLKGLQGEVAAMRADYLKIGQAFTGMSARFQNIDHRFTEVERRIDAQGDDLITNLKMEIMGSMANLETRLEQRMEAMFSNFEGNLNSRLGRMENLLGQLTASITALRQQGPVRIPGFENT